MHPHLQRLMAFFSGISADFPVPPQSRFRPEALGWLQGCFCTVEVLTAEKDYRFHICGAYMRLFYGRDLSGIRLSEADRNQDLKDLRRDFDHVVLARRPRYSSGEILWDSGLHQDSEWLIMPFSGACGRISMLLVAEKTAPLPRDFALLRPTHGPKIQTHTQIWPAATPLHKKILPANMHHH